MTTVTLFNARPAESLFLDLELVVPTCNEEGVITDRLKALADRLEEIDISAGIAVVDNGSSDRTPEVVDAFMRTCRIPVRLLGCSAPGWDPAVRRGLVSSRARWVGLIDPSLVVPDFVDGVLALLRNGYDVVVDAPATGSPRRRRGQARRNRVRHSRGRPGRYGVRLFDRVTAQRLFEHAPPTESDGDLEILVRAQHMALHIAECELHQPGRPARRMRRMRRMAQAVRRMAVAGRAVGPLAETIAPLLDGVPPAPNKA
jgi:dolichyl-phosphate beta-glucosyltransferase